MRSLEPRRVASLVRGSTAVTVGRGLALCGSRQELPVRSLSWGFRGTLSSWAARVRISSLLGHAFSSLFSHFKILDVYLTLDVDVVIIIYVCAKLVVLVACLDS